MPRKRTTEACNALSSLARSLFLGRGLRSGQVSNLDERQLRDIGVSVQDVAAMVDRDMSNLLCRDLWRSGPKDGS